MARLLESVKCKRAPPIVASVKSQDWEKVVGLIFFDGFSSPSLSSPSIDSSTNGLDSVGGNNSTGNMVFFDLIKNLFPEGCRVSRSSTLVAITSAVYDS